MVGTIGEIRLFAGSFAPRDWALCQGQQVAVRANTALFAILGTNYGGNGTTIYMLPDFAGRTAIGAGQGLGLSVYDVGQQGGSINVTLTQSEMTAHTHVATPTLSTPGSATATLYGSNSGDSYSPGGNYIGTDGGTSLFSTDTSAPVAMASASLAVTNVTATQISSITLANAGGSLPHNNMQPYLVLNYIICTSGDFPARN